MNTSQQLLQEELLVYGPSYAMVPRNTPTTENFAVVEHARMKLKQGEAEELRGEAKAVIKKIHTPYLISQKKRGRQLQS